MAASKWRRTRTWGHWGASCTSASVSGKGRAQTVVKCVLPKTRTPSIGCGEQSRICIREMMRSMFGKIPVVEEWETSSRDASAKLNIEPWDQNWVYGHRIEKKGAKLGTWEAPACFRVSWMRRSIVRRTPGFPTGLDLNPAQASYSVHLALVPSFLRKKSKYLTLVLETEADMCSCLTRGCHRAGSQDIVAVLTCWNG